MTQHLQSQERWEVRRNGNHWTSPPSCSLTTCWVCQYCEQRFIFITFYWNKLLILWIFSTWVSFFIYIYMSLIDLFSQLKEKKKRKHRSTLTHWKTSKTRTKRSTVVFFLWYILKLLCRLKNGPKHFISGSWLNVLNSLCRLRNTETWCTCPSSSTERTRMSSMATKKSMNCRYKSKKYSMEIFNVIYILNTSYK